MKQLTIIIVFVCLLITSCTSSKKLAYLYIPPETASGESFTMNIPDYRIQTRDILYITVKAMTSDGRITDFLSSSAGNAGINISQGESGGFLYGFDVDPTGNIIVPAIGTVRVEGLTLEE